MTNLIQRRFVACMYDVAEPGRNFGDAWAYDADATRALGKMEARRQGRGRGGTQERDGRVRADSYPTALFLASDGTELGDGLWGILPPEKLLAGLQEVIARWPQHFAPTAEEAATLRTAQERPEDPAARLAAARLRWELAEFASVVELAQRDCPRADAAQRAELGYLAGRALTCLGRDADARVELLRAEKDAPAGDLAAAVQVALARLLMRARQFDAALVRLQPLTVFEQPGAWTGAAFYHAGLCHHRMGDKDQAKTLWRRHRAELPFDRLARRSAASLGLPEAQAFLNQELIETKGWW